METLTINSTNSELLLSIYKKITREMAGEFTSISLSVDKTDIADEKNMDIRTYGEDKWIRFGDMMNLLLEQLEYRETEPPLRFTCRGFCKGDYIKLTEFASENPYLIKVDEKNRTICDYRPNNDEMFTYMWKKVTTE